MVKRYSSSDNRRGGKVGLAPDNTLNRALGAPVHADSHVNRPAVPLFTSCPPREQGLGPCERAALGPRA